MVIPRFFAEGATITLSSPTLIDSTWAFTRFFSLPIAANLFAGFFYSTRPLVGAYIIRLCKEPRIIIIFHMFWGHYIDCRALEHGAERPTPYSRVQQPTNCPQTMKYFDYYMPFWCFFFWFFFYTSYKTLTYLFLAVVSLRTVWCFTARRKALCFAIDSLKTIFRLEIVERT